MTSPSQPQDANPIMAKALTIKDIRLQFSPPRKLSFPARRYQVRVTVGAESCSSKASEETEENSVSWDGGMDFVVQDPSVNLVVEVYQKHRIRKDELIGSLCDPIGRVLDNVRDGVLEQLLNGSSGCPVPSEMKTKFRLASEPLGDLDEDGLRATVAVAQGTNAVMPLGVAPAPVQLLGSAIDNGTNVVAQVQAFDNTWGIFLQRLKLFNDIMTSIAEIHPYTSMAWSVISAANQVLINQAHRDESIVHLAGTMRDVFDFVHDTEALKTIKQHAKMIKLLLQQVTECGYFIATYAKLR